MMGCGHFPNNYTFSFVFRACGEICDGSLGLMYHTLVVKLGWENYDFVKNGLIHFYAGNNCMDFARSLFDECTFRDVVTWSCMINGYLKCGELSLAKELFDQMPEKNAVSWSVMINGCSQMGFFNEAREFFVDMMDAGFRPNRAAVVGALTACSFLGNLDQGRWIHGYVERSEVELDTVLGTALVDMYAKCGCMDMACHVFEEIPCKDIVAYTSLISGLADHGVGIKVLEVFKRMKTEGIRPNAVTFVGVLSACSRAGLVGEGVGIFESMKVEYGIQPTVKHYGCLVDLFGRSGRLDQAKDVLRKMPMEPDQYVVGALLNACRVHGDMDIEQEVVKWLEQTIPHSSGIHVLISNIYATSDQWDNVQKVRERMQEKQVEKTPGYSFVTTNDVV
ncbi:hypothetical protein Leryth_019040 [Lithospermum erythrorhizon]|nr:hypothetical protein Leryth_019040 [Lithospermum erythrorhizon]